MTIFDGAQTQLGQVLGQDAPSGQGVDVDSALPYVLVVTAQNVDADAVLFDYAGQAWGSNDQGHHCDFGAYDGGSRYVIFDYPCGHGVEGMYADFFGGVGMVIAGLVVRGIGIWCGVCNVMG